MSVFDKKMETIRKNTPLYKKELDDTTKPIVEPVMEEKKTMEEPDEEPTDLLYEYPILSSLQKDFYIDREIDNEYRVMYVPYIIETLEDKPFLLFLLEKQEFLSFPSFVLDTSEMKPSIKKEKSTKKEPEEGLQNKALDSLVSLVEGGNKEDELDPFESQIFSFYANYIGKLKEDIEAQYKGFVEYSNVVYVMIEHSPLDETPDTTLLVTIDELKQRVSMNIPIAEEVLYFFSEFSSAGYLINENEEQLEIPKLTYLVEIENDIYENVYYEKETPKHSVSIIEPTVSHKLFGDVIMLSDSIYPSNKDITKIKRHILFTMDAVFIFEDSITDALIEPLLTHSKLTYEKEDKQLWLLQNSIYSYPLVA